MARSLLQRSRPCYDSDGGRCWGGGYCGWGRFLRCANDFITGLQSDSAADIQRALGEVTQLHDGLALAIGKIGSEIQSVETQIEINADTRLRLQSMLSNEQDLDIRQRLLALIKK